MTDGNPHRQKAIAEQERAADPRHWVFVSANAGSGKTHVLVNRVIRLLLEGAKPEQILCVTFTKAAASEMLSRLFARLGEFSVLPLDDLRAQLRLLQADREFGEDDLLRARRLFAQALETPGGLKIRTIHSFCESLIRQFPMEAGVSPAFRLVEGRELEDLQEGVKAEIGEAIVAGKAPELAEAMQVLVANGVSNADAVFQFALDKSQELVELNRRPGGLDAAIAQSAAALGVGVDDTPESVVQAGLALIGEDLPRQIIGALQQLGTATEQNKANEAQQDWQSGTAEQRLQALRPLVLKADWDYPKKIATKEVLYSAPDFAHWAKKLQKELRTIRRQKFPAQCFVMTRAALTLANALAVRLEEQRAARGWLVFDDLIHKVQELLQEGPSRDWVLYKLDNRLAHVLGDEAQDNSPPQWQLLQNLVEEFCAGKGSELVEQTRTLFAVGDPKQSIYGFQGAKPELFERIREQYRDRQWDTLNPLQTPKLALSWRSTPEVLQFVDACFAPKGEQAPETKFQGPAPEHEPAVPAGPGFGQYLTHEAERQGQRGSVIVYPPFEYHSVEADKDPGAPVDRMAASDAKARLAHEVAKNVKGMVADGLQVHVRAAGWWRKRPVQFGDIYILVRSRNDLFREMIRQLKLQQIPVAGADHITLQSETAVQDLLSLANFCLQPGDDLSLAEVLRSPLLHPVGRKVAPIDEDALMHLAMERGEQSLWVAVQEAKQDVWREARTWLSDLIKRAGKETPYGFFAGLLNRPFAHGDTPLQRIYGRLTHEAEDGLQEFLTQALDASREPDNSLTTFVTGMAAREDEVQRQLDSAGNVVRVMTVHGAKGLEAPVVILPQTNNKPGGRNVAGLQQHAGGAWLWMGSEKEDCKAQASIRDQNALMNAQENQRLLYVALTRAQDHLRIFCAERGSENEPVLDDGWYAQCQRAMKKLASADAVQEFHEPDWHEKAPGYKFGETARADAGAKNENMASVPLPQWAKSPLPGEEQADVRTPSSLTDTAEARAISVSPLRDDAKRRFLRGNLIHALLEGLPQQPQDQWRAAAEHFLARQPDLDDVQADDIKRAVFGVLENPEYADLFGPDSRAELPIVGLGENGAMIGQIDRLVVRDDSVLIVDFKSNRPPAQNVEEVPQSYKAQMRAYADLLQQIWPQKRIETALLWTDGPRLMRL